MRAAGHTGVTGPARVTFLRFLRCAVAVAAGELLAAVLLAAAAIAFRTEPLFAAIRETRWPQWLTLSVALYLLANIVLALRCWLSRRHAARCLQQVQN